MDSSAELIAYSRPEEGIATVTLNRAGKRNAPDVPPGTTADSHRAPQRISVRGTPNPPSVRDAAEIG